MDIQSMCIGHKVGELSEVALGLLGASLQHHSPPASTSSLSPTPSHRTIKPRSSKARHTKRQTSHKKRRAIKHPNLVPIAPKLETGGQVRYRRSRNRESESSRSPPTDRSYGVGLPSSSRIYNSHGMVDVDLLYARMTPAERASFKVPGTSVFKVSKATLMEDLSSTSTHACSSCGRACCTENKVPAPKDIVMEPSETLPPQSYAPTHPIPVHRPDSPLPGFSRMLEHAGGLPLRHADTRPQQYV